MINYLSGVNFNYGVVDNLLKTLSATGQQRTLLAFACTSKKIFDHYMDLYPLLLQDWRFIIASDDIILKIVPTEEMWRDWIRNNQVHAFQIHDRKTLQTKSYDKYTKKDIVNGYLPCGMHSEIKKNRNNDKKLYELFKEIEYEEYIKDLYCQETEKIKTHCLDLEGEKENDQSFCDLAQRYDFIKQTPKLKRIVVFAYTDGQHYGHQCIHCCDFFTIDCQCKCTKCKKWCKCNFRDQGINCTYCVAHHIFKQYDSAEDAYKDILVDTIDVDIENIIHMRYGGGLGRCLKNQHYLFWDTVKNKMILNICMDWQGGWGGTSNDNFAHLKSLIRSGFLRKDPSYQRYKPAQCAVA